MNTILIPVAFVTAGGAALGLILGLAAKFMYVPVDSLAEDIRAVLPGANCGACGYVGCMEYAEKLASGEETKTNLCTPGGDNGAAAICAALGVEASDVIEMTSVVHCGGTCDKTRVAVDYQGPPTCKACATYFNGKGECSYGCMGFGDCVAVCMYNAIYLNNGVPTVDKSMCTGCSMCVRACPHHLISLEIQTGNIHVACSSHDKGAVTRKACSAGCIGCSRCVKECEFGAITVTDNLASIDPEKCTNCQKCVAVCPTKCIQVCE